MLFFNQRLSVQLFLQQHLTLWSKWQFKETDLAGIVTTRNSGQKYFETGSKTNYPVIDLKLGYRFGGLKRK